MTTDEIFWTKVNKVNSGCWEWAGALNHMGYGQFCVNGKNLQAHRYSYETFKEKIPFRLVIDHLCRNPKCVNPDHLEPVTHRINSLRGVGIAAISVQKTHCSRGHLLTLENVYFRHYRDKSQWQRVCLVCKREHQKGYLKRRLKREPNYWERYFPKSSTPLLE